IAPTTTTSPATGATTGTTAGDATVPATTGAASTTGSDTHSAAPIKTAQADTNVTAAPNGQITNAPEGASDNRRLEMMGMAAGGGLVLVGVILWLEASSAQGDINSAPTKSPKDFQNLSDLESRADTYANIGNVAVVGGVVLAGVSGFFYWRDHEARAAQEARLAPAVFDHGAGLTLTIGGAR